MAEREDRALLLRRIPYGDSSLICHFLTERHGRMALMARGARRPKSGFRGALEPLYGLQIRWRPGRTGMGTLLDLQRGDALLPPERALQGLALLAVVSRLFQEGDPHGFEECRAALALLDRREGEAGVLMALWQLLDAAGWLGDLSHCWHCGADSGAMMQWQRGQLLCPSCGAGIGVSAGLRKSIAACMAGQSIILGRHDLMTWREMIRQLLREHGIHMPQLEM